MSERARILRSVVLVLLVTMVTAALAAARAPLDHGKDQALDVGAAVFLGLFAVVLSGALWALATKRS